MLNIPKVAQYARFSSYNQRSESIDAQIRAMNQFCKQNHWQVVSTYTDEARSATTDNRPQFQQMIADSGKGLFDIVLVHKLDRFSRDRYDSAIYKKKLKKNHVRLCSVLERMDDSPESIMMEAVLEGMSEYYSRNLAREVMKGMNETALQCKHTGGCPPLGYDLDENRHLIVNESEAQAVRIIFQMFADGHGYTTIIDYLNAHGYKTKRGKMFGKNSLYEILNNEKYTGVFVFNKAAARTDGKRMIGNLRFSGRSKTRLATYRCNTHRAACNNKELNKDYLDAYIAVLIGERLKPKNLRKAVSKVNQQVQKFNHDFDANHEAISAQYAEIQDSLANITRAIEKGIFTDDLLQRAEQLENEKTKLETRLHELKLLEPIVYEDVAYLHTQWKELKRNTEEFRTFIQQFVKAIHVRPYDFDIVLDMGFGVVELTETIPMRRGELYEMFDSKVKEQRICLKNQKAGT